MSLCQLAFVQSLRGISGGLIATEGRLRHLSAMDWREDDDVIQLQPAVQPILPERRVLEGRARGRHG